MPSLDLAGVWVQQQRLLREALLSHRDRNDGAAAPDQAAVVDRALSRYEAHHRARTASARSDPVRFVAAPGSTTDLERGVHWIGGWRPTTFVHLLYTDSGARLDAFFHGGEDVVGHLSADQMMLVDALQRRAIAEENRISREMEELQASWVGSGAEEVDGWVEGLGGVVEKAEELRMRTLRELVAEILVPGQAVDFLVALAEFEIGVRWVGLERERVRV